MKLSPADYFATVHFAASYIASPWYEFMYRYIDNKSPIYKQACLKAKTIAIVLYDQECSTLVSGKPFRGFK